MKKQWHYYNDTDPFVCEWVRNLIAAGEVPDGRVDERSISEVQPDDLREFMQCHFFCGILGWPLALRLAGWPADAPVWTGSCPCQPYSAAGKRQGDADPRNLWPAFFRLIRECRPPIVFGEQVSSAIRHGWLDGVCRDMEAEGYAVGAAVLGAHSVGAPHIRQRLFWVAARELGDTNGPRLRTRRGSERCECGETREPVLAEGGKAGGLADNAWDDFAIVHCRDEKARRISAQPGDEPLAHGIPRSVGSMFAGLRGMATAARRNRVGRLKGYGNAIVPQIAAEFILAFMEARYADT